MNKSLLSLLIGVVLSCLCVSCEEEEDFGFPSKIEITSKGDTIDVKGSNDLPPSILQIELLDYNGDGSNSGIPSESQDCIEASTEWLTVKYYAIEYRLQLIAQPNETDKKRNLYLYLYDGRSRQEIKVIQNK